MTDRSPAASPGQHPVELILARNLIGPLSVAGAVLDAAQRTVFFNRAAAGLVGVGFEETGPLSPKESEYFGPLDGQGRGLPEAKRPLTLALRAGRPAHAALRLRHADGKLIEVDATALPLAGERGYVGALVVFWPLPGGGPA